MDNDSVQNDQQKKKKLAEQLIKEKYQAWKLLAIGFLLRFTIYSLGKLYVRLRTYSSVSDIKWVGENTVNFPSTKKNGQSWQMKVSNDLNIFFWQISLYFSFDLCFNLIKRFNFSNCRGA